MSFLIATTAEDRASCFAIREQVFVQEQGVPHALELDALDAVAVHFLVRDDQTGEPLATARLLNKGDAAKIGRVAVLPPARGQGIGRELMQAILAEAQSRHFSEAVLDAQTAVIPFYERLGFIAEGPEFLDANIPHRTMRRQITKINR